MESFDFIDYHQRLKTDMGQVLAGSGGDGDLSVIMLNLLDQVETTLADHLTADDHKTMACAAGCSSCCVINVSVLFPEAVNIARHLRKNLDAEDLELLQHSMKKMVNVISGLDEEERIAVRRKCIFLNAQGQCDIYPVRPLLCRALTSTSAADCRDALAMQALGEQVPIMMNLFQKNLFDVTFQALAAALEETALDDRSLELTEAVLQQLQMLAACRT
ncbi:MAG: YkgJ family cysteine cluster protein [Thermodesulfobacteriota bacterium]|nr:YkgJ family cysteine cluster protein [Thermodesulfobacteriota bacterium]